MTDKEYTAQITLTEENLETAREALDYSRDNTVLFESDKRITEVIKKINEAQNKVREEKNRRQSSHDCEEQGHDWGEMDVREDAEITHLYKGCNVCPKLAYKPIDGGTWIETEDWEEYLDQTGREIWIGASKQ